jgi:putative ABC transport system permease protein
LIRSFVALSGVDPGFQAGHVVALDVSLVDKRYLDEHRRIEFTQAMVEAAKTLPGVDEAAGIYGLPLGSMVNVAFDFSLEGAPIPNRGREWRTAFRLASPGYFRLLGVPLKAGRDFTGQDRTNTPLVAIVNEAFVRQFLPRTDPIGKRIRVADSPDPKVSGNPTEIVGVVGDVKADALDGPAPPELYRPFSQACEWYVSLVVRAADAGVGFQQAVRKAVNAVDPRCPVYHVRTLDSQISRSLAPRRFTLSVIWLFAVVALGLAAVGVYGVMAYSVSRRTREMGIRLALGASQNAVLGLVLREGMSLVVIGTLLGVGLSLGLSGLLSNQLYGVSATDPLTLALAALVLIATAALACWWPARRAARVDPMEALKRE